MLNSVGLHPGRALHGRMAIALMLLVGAAGCSDRPEVGPHIQSKLLTFSSCHAPSDPPLAVKISSVAADPSRFDGRQLSVRGYFCTGFERSGVFETRDCDTAAQSGLWITGVPIDFQFDGDRVEMVGRFNGNAHGHLDQWPGSLCVHSIRLDEPGARFRTLGDAKVPKR